MRTAFFETLAQIAHKEERIILLTADLGFRAIEPFSDTFPERFINVGVAEQNMVGIATGLAEAGYIPFIYSIIPFTTLRPFEFIRNGPIAHQYPVRIVGVGSGVDYSTNGISHYGLEDLGVFRTQPGISLIIPADTKQTKNALLATWDRREPIYYRLGKGYQSAINGLNGHYKYDEFDILESGSDLIIFSVGSITNEVLAARELLLQKGIAATVVLISTIHFENCWQIAELLYNFPLAVTVENHYINGGIGSMIAEVIAENGIKCKLLRCGFKKGPDGLTGSKEFLYQKNGLSPVDLFLAIVDKLGR